MNHRPSFIYKTMMWSFTKRYKSLLLNYYGPVLKSLNGNEFNFLILHFNYRLMVELQICLWIIIEMKGACKKLNIKYLFNSIGAYKWNKGFKWVKIQILPGQWLPVIVIVALSALASIFHFCLTPPVSVMHHAIYKQKKLRRCNTIPIVDYISQRLSYYIRMFQKYIRYKLPLLCYWNICFSQRPPNKLSGVQ